MNGKITFVLAAFLMTMLLSCSFSNAVECIEQGMPCSGTVFDPCCRDMMCDKKDMFKQGTCGNCIGSEGYCIDHSQCCTGLYCRSLKCRAE
ncbi:hypothetical protein Ciccas_002163 [Cichlidogyrus casuarinus]|uniref:UPF0506 domain-containing protein n=1 Tax=Cichlidogyrus casuarinus TaxID=1844966 RepID=A0ABD2QHZ9_9PLAT